MPPFDDRERASRTTRRTSETANLSPTALSHCLVSPRGRRDAGCEISFFYSCFISLAECSLQPLSAFAPAGAQTAPALAGRPDASRRASPYSRGLTIVSRSNDITWSIFPPWMTDDVVSPASLHSRRNAMKTIISTLIALSVLAGIAAPASALDASTFFEQQERQKGG